VGCVAWPKDIARLQKRERRCCNRQILGRGFLLPIFTRLKPSPVGLVPPTLPQSESLRRSRRTPETSDYTGRGDRNRATSVSGEDRTRAQQAHAWDGVAVGARAVWMSPIELTNSTMRVAPVWKTPVDAQVPKISRSFVSRTGVCWDWTGRPIATRQSGQESPSTWGPILSRIGLDPPGWLWRVRSSDGVQASRRHARKSLAQEAIRLRDRPWVVRPRESASAVFGTKAARFNCRSRNQGEWPEVNRCAAIRPVSRAVAVPTGASKGIDLRKSQGTHTIRAAT